MKINYDKKANALYIKFKTVPVKSTALLGSNIMLDLDANKKIIGIEILEANKQVSNPSGIMRSLVAELN